MEYIEKNRDEFNTLLKTLTETPSWTGGEKARADFCYRYLSDLGYDKISIDTAGNVICEFNIRDDRNNICFIAHLDTVFSEEVDFTIKKKDGKLYCPGIGDNTANVTGLLILAKYIKDNNITPECGIYFVLSTGEEGLGNLIGSRTFTEKYKEKIKSFIALDLYYDKIFDTCVGSIRYDVNIKTEGGHSYLAFGKKNAIAVLSEIISKVYSGDFNLKDLTYNVGNIKGGTTVNTIAASASMLFEFRSLRSDMMKEADRKFRDLLKSYISDEVDISVDVIGLRPCAEEVDRDEMEEMVSSAKAAIIESNLKEPEITSASTDCNIPLSYSIPSICFGVCEGGNAHSLNEWITEKSNIKGIEVLFRFFRKYVLKEK